MRHLSLTETLQKLLIQTQTGKAEPSPCTNACGGQALHGMECEACLTGHLQCLVGRAHAETLKCAMTSYHAAGGGPAAAAVLHLQMLAIKRQMSALN